jgi:hypothetical protein
MVTSSASSVSAKQRKKDKFQRGEESPLLSSFLAPSTTGYTCRRNLLVFTTRLVDTLKTVGICCIMAHWKKGFYCPKTDRTNRKTPWEADSARTISFASQSLCYCSYRYCTLDGWGLQPSSNNLIDWRQKGRKKSTAGTRSHFVLAGRQSPFKMPNVLSFEYSFE